MADYFEEIAGFHQKQNRKTKLFLSMNAKYGLRWTTSVVCGSGRILISATDSSTINASFILRIDWHNSNHKGKSNTRRKNIDDHTACWLSSHASNTASMSHVLCGSMCCCWNGCLRCWLAATDWQPHRRACIQQHTSQARLTRVKLHVIGFAGCRKKSLFCCFFASLNMVRGQRKNASVLFDVR